MKMLVGLGNPTEEYAKTRHNVGFWLVDKVAEKLGISFQGEEKGLVAKAKIGADTVLIVKPMTYMNKSGECVGQLARYYKVDISDIVVCYDDMDLPVGLVRIRPKGSPGGHNGLKSLVQHLGGEAFPRIRIGIGRPNADVIDYVLGEFNADDKAKVEAAIDYLLPAAHCIFTDGIDMAMNKYNPKKAKNNEGSTA